MFIIILFIAKIVNKAFIKNHFFCFYKFLGFKKVTNFMKNNNT